MEKFTGLFTMFPLACGLLFAQADTPKTPTPASTPVSETRPSPASSTSGSTPAIQQWRGTLVDASCASGTKTAASATAGSNQNSASKQTTDQDSNVDSGRPHKGHRNRATKASEAGCAVSNSTSVFALQTEAGQVMRFDSIGNSRAAETLKSKEKWTKELAASKPTRAKVSGILAGDTITVTSLD
jgi:hypothetical protein